tara:strand:- start:3215 stop:3871 length:657 start_codon:yes stop_codon:yes gene_type:complete
MILKSYLNGLSLGSGVYLLGRCLDMTLSADSYLRLMSIKGELLDKGLQLCRKNLLVVGPVVFTVVDIFLINHTLFFSFRDMGDILIIHSIGYYFAHRTMHENSIMKRIHIFHHKFDQLLIPSIGNAVSVEEFCFAYMLPFIVGALLVRPGSLSFINAVGMISIANLFIHCKELEHIKLMELFVSPKKHINHHKTYNRHYSAPILDLEYLFAMDQKRTP